MDVLYTLRVLLNFQYWLLNCYLLFVISLEQTSSWPYLFLHSWDLHLSRLHQCILLLLLRLNWESLTKQYLTRKRIILMARDMLSAHVTKVSFCFLMQLLSYCDVLSMKRAIGKYCLYNINHFHFEIFFYLAKMSTSAVIRTQIRTQ